MTEVTKEPVVGGQSDLTKPAIEFLLEMASMLQSEAFGDTVMLSIVDELNDPDMEKPICITLYLSTPEELGQITEHVEDTPLPDMLPGVKIH